MAGVDYLGAEDHDDYPVFHVGVLDAYRCARWMKGLLPTVEQWDAAAGIDRSEVAEGPYRGHWDSEERLDIAVEPPRNGTCHVGSCKDDVNIFGLRDMAGNGQEWTASILDQSKTVPLEEPSSPSSRFAREATPHARHSIIERCAIKTKLSRNSITNDRRPSLSRNPTCFQRVNLISLASSSTRCVYTRSQAGQQT